jgi:hypothetical protein
MSEHITALARRAVACKGWRWMSGMRWRTEDDRGRLDDYQPEYMGRPPDALPDLTDPATLGCLLACVREAWNDQRAYMRAGFGWEWITDYCVERWPPGGETEAEALVAALEGAP